MKKLLLKNATVLTVNPAKDILKNIDILIEGNKISQIAVNINEQADKVIDASNKVVLPGFIQTHIHLCQTMFKGMAENRELLDWLRERIWPLEASHNEKSMYYSALLGIGEMISSGTTTFLDMGAVYNSGKIFDAIADSGVRAVAGKAMMDCGLGVPEGSLETTEYSMEESLKLYKKWNNAENGRIKYAFAPRFILSVSDKLFYDIKDASDEYNILVHTHAYENKNEGKEIFELKGMKEFEYFDKIGLLNEKFLAAHCVWTDEYDMKLMQEKGVKVLHCPSSNFKLGSGMLNLTKYLSKGISVSIGADGSPCNNNLDMFQEIRTTALMQNVLNKPGAVEAHKFIELATIEGAKALGLEDSIGSIEVGKKADLIILDLDEDFNSWHSEDVDLPTQIVYSAKANNVKTVIVDGEILMENRIFKTIDKQEIMETSKIEAQKLVQRAKSNLIYA